ncbi:unnamed protein product, partial [Ectocarpus sp. 8 AP-2014]
GLQVPSKSPFAAPLEHMQRLMPLMEEQVASSEEVLTDLLDKLSDMGLEDSVSSWFDGDSMQSFFEFQVNLSATKGWSRHTLFSCVNLIAFLYRPAESSDVRLLCAVTPKLILTSIKAYTTPALCGRLFPNVSAKGRGYQIRAMTKGPEGWEELRKVSVWQTTAALQQEMEAKMIKAEEKESAETRAGGSELDGGGQEGEEHAKETSAMMIEGGAASATNEQGGSSGAGWAGGDRADPAIGGSGGGFPGAISSTTGGGSAQAQPKHSGAGDRGGVGRGIGAVGADENDHDDRPSRGGGIHESKRPWETGAIRGRTNGLETGSKDNSGEPPGVSQASASAGAKSGPVIGNERHHAAAKALTNTKVCMCK